MADGNGFGRIVVKDEAQGVGIVHGNVENDAATGFRPLQPPALQMRRQIDRMEDPCRDRPADPPFGDGIPHRPVGSGVAQVMVGAKHHAGFACGDNHFARILQRHRQGLFT